MVINELDTKSSELGEGIYIDEENSILYWLDINESHIYQYDLNIMRLIKRYDVSNKPSCIFFADDTQIRYADNQGVKRLCLQSGCSSILYIHEKHNSIDFRANDGTRLLDGTLIYGTMSYKPDSSPGKLYIYEPYHKLSHCFEFDIHIPNTFVQVKDKLYISDSLKKKTYTIDLVGNSWASKPALRLWRDFSNEVYTPDGGCVSSSGFLHIALWGGGAVGVFNDAGGLVSLIEVPALQPTNCAIYSSRWLFVTTAKEGMSAQQLSDYPSSGKTFMIDLGESYEY